MTETKIDINPFIKNAKKMKWGKKRTAETLHYLGFSDEQINEMVGRE